MEWDLNKRVEEVGRGKVEKRREKYRKNEEGENSIMEKTRQIQ